MNPKRVLKANVGKIAAITVDLIKHGVAVCRVGDAYPAEELSPHEKSLWFVSVPHDSPLAEEAMTIPTAFSEAEAWELAIEYLATDHDVTEEPSAGVKTHRRPLRKVWQDMRVQGAYSVACESHAAAHYGDSFPAWDRLACWLRGAAAGFFNDGSWMPITWRLAGKSPADWYAFVVPTQDDKPVLVIGYAEEPASR